MNYRLTYLFALLILPIIGFSQIKTFNLKKVDYIYLSYTPGDGPFYTYDYNSTSDFLYQYNDLIEFGGIVNIWKGLNVNVGLGFITNFQDIDKFEYPQSNNGSYGYSQLRGVMPNIGLSYSLGYKNILLIPFANTIIGQEWEVFDYYDDTWNRYTIGEDSRGPYQTFEFGLDLVYKNYLLGVSFQNVDYYYENILPVTLKVGYGFERKNIKANF